MLAEALNFTLINAQAQEILARFGRHRNFQSYIAANDTRVCDQVSPIKEVGRGFNDVGHVVTATEEAQKQIHPDFGNGCVR